ncbi:response regulator [Aerosakkonema sp. BLCC-F183]|uniref:response regulator n=1 Tax=Aerosakkonema sp. BLCC-F183 TaxID=3342834 RepID=UPI0035B8B037
MSKRILVIDDEYPLRRVIQLALKMTVGWEVLTAGSGEEAIQKAETERPDAIILDVMMPEMDGSATLAHLRANKFTQYIPIILLTAKVQVVEQKYFANLGVAAAIVKPFDPATLAYQIAKALNWDISTTVDSKMRD